MKLKLRHANSRRVLRLVVTVALLMSLNACALRPVQTLRPTLYSLDVPTMTDGRIAPPVQAPTLLVNPVLAAAGFDSNHIIYSHLTHELDYFAHSEWIDTPAHMLTPLIVATLANSGTFHAVAVTGTATAGDLRLVTELVRLQQDFTTIPAQLHFTLRATVLDNATRKVLAWREVNQIVAVSGDTPYDGVVAANQAVQSGLQQLSAFCLAVTRDWQVEQNAQIRK